jgi:hypothetical protein
MNYLELEKANKLKKQIDTLYDLKRACCKTYLKVFPAKVKKGNMVFRLDNDILIADEGLNEVISTYCNKRIEDLKKELEAL